AQRAERPGLQERGTAVRTQEDDPRMVYPGPAGQPMPHPGPALPVRRQEEVAGLRDVRLRGAAQHVVETVRRLVEIGSDFRLGRATEPQQGEDNVSHPS